MGALVVAVVAGAPFLAGERYSGRDHTRVLVPSLCALASHDDGRSHAILDELRGDGPALENPQGRFFAPETRALLAVLSPEDAASAFTWLWLVLAAPATAYLASSFGARRRGQLVAALAQAFAGTTIDLVLHGSFLVGAALLPLVWGGARHLRRRARVRARDIAAVSIGLGLLALEGHVHMDFIAGVLVVVEAAVAFAWSRRARAAWLALSSCAGTLLASLQLVSSTSLGAAVQRAHGVDSTTTWPLEFPEAIGVLLPIVSTKRVDVGASLVTAWHHDVAARASWNATPFLGAIALAALVTAAFARRTRPVVVVALVAVLFAVGAHTPVFPLATALIPPLGLFRYPAKYFELASLCACVASGVVVEGALRARRLRIRLQLALLALAVITAVTALGLLVERTAIEDAAHAVATHAPFAESSLSSTLLVAALTSCAFASLGALSLLRARTATLLPFLVVAELASFAFVALPTSEPVFDHPRPLQSLPAGSEVCIGHDIGALRLDVSVDGQRTDTQLYGDTIADLIDNKPDVGACGGPASPDDYTPSAQHTVVQLSRFLVDEAHGVIGPARALGCTHLVTRANVSSVSDLQRVPLGDALAPATFAIVDAIPDATVAHEPHVIDDEATLLHAIVASHTAQDVLALVDDPAHALASKSLPDGAGIAHVHATFTSATDVVVDVEGSGGAVIVLRRSWWPGWSAQQNGADLHVVRVAGRELGIVVDDVTRGPITLHYRVRRLPIAIALCALGVAFLIALIVFVRVRAR